MLASAASGSDSHSSIEIQSSQSTFSSFNLVHYHNQLRSSRTPGKLFGWGSGLFSSLPVSDGALDNSGDCIYPAPLQGLGSTNFVKICADMTVFAAIDSDGRLWAWGTDKCSFLSTVPTALQIPNDESVIDCDVGAYFIVAITSSGTVALIGKPPLAKISDASPRPVIISSGLPDANSFPALQVSACSDAFAVLCADGRVYSCGSAINNGLGSDSALPAEIPNLPCPILSVSIGSRVGCAVAVPREWVNSSEFEVDQKSSHHSSHQLHIWGDGRTGAFGIGHRVLKHQHTPIPCTSKFVSLPDSSGSTRNVHIVSACATRGQPGPKCFSSGKTFNSGQEGPRVHVVTEDGGLWIAGTTHKGLGANHISKTMQPSADHLEFYRVGGIAADTKLARVFTGAAEDIPKLAPNSSHASSSSSSAKFGAGKQAAVSSSSSIDLPVSAERIAWRLGMSDVGDFCKDGVTNYLSAAQIVFSVPVHIHSLALSADGRLFAWGCGSNGRTGLRALMRGPGGSKRVMKCYVSTPSAIEALENKRVVNCAAGKYWSFAIVAADQE